MEHRNEAAHESAEVFADLLTSEMYHDTTLYLKWKDAFPVVYGATVEDLARQYQERELDLDIF